MTAACTIYCLITFYSTCSYFGGAAPLLFILVETGGASCAEGWTGSFLSSLLARFSLYLFCLGPNACYLKERYSGIGSSCNGSSSFCSSDPGKFYFTGLPFLSDSIDSLKFWFSYGSSSRCLFTILTENLLIRLVPETLCMSYCWEPKWLRRPIFCDFYRFNARFWLNEHSYLGI